jgi:hypothetical protein
MLRWRIYVTAASARIPSQRYFVGLFHTPHYLIVGSGQNFKRSKRRVAEVALSKALALTLSFGYAMLRG